ncbi:polysaccharide biosynthesis protein [Sulfurimonas crateris]|uniref:Polysaccharide biosynthesis protein n=1 Tax=Sulfurimonas crateris TaxID=2574727 RepID=A0A4U2Z8S6_9BACT|nr:nucleoside-diphosphate sugar epimerase/dehydratase [Sulfurimonas crateris]TKI69900.1 polysaccharide biosynthesis protein [Sulfurimonas crateris]
MKPTPLKRVLFFLFFDILISLGTLFLAYNLRFNFTIEDIFIENFLAVFALLVSVKVTFMALFHIYGVAWRFFSLGELKKILYVHLFAYPVVLFLYYLSPETFNPFPRSVLMIDFFLSILFLGLFRVLKRLIVENDKNLNLTKSLLIGTTPLAQALIKDKTNYYIAAVVDDEEENIGTYFSNMKVSGINEIAKAVESLEIRSVIIAKDFEANRLNEIYEKLKKLKIHDIKILSLKNQEKKLKDLSIEDLLARRPKDLDKESIKNFIDSRVILITGAGGSIGSEISRQCLEYGAKQLILLDHSEFNLYSIGEELKSDKMVFVMQSVVDKASMEKVFETYKPQIVIHAAAYKHVPLVEQNIEQAIINNVIGTKNSIDLSIKHGVEKFVLISTDKAVRPTSVMGATKRICELYAQNVPCKETEIVSVRFGNVLGSSGSVIPLFKKQIQEGGPLTITHPDVTRYFMLIGEACELVLQAASIGKGGEVFVLDMGEPVKILDLAKKMIELSSKEEIDISFIGLRPGEKLYEELFLDMRDAKTQYDSIAVAQKTHMDIEKLNNDIAELITAKDKVTKLKEIVVEFKA